MQTYEHLHVKLNYQQNLQNNDKTTYRLGKHVPA